MRVGDTEYTHDDILDEWYVPDWGDEKISVEHQECVSEVYRLTIVLKALEREYDSQEQTLRLLQDALSERQRQVDSLNAHVKSIDTLLQEPRSGVGDSLQEEHERKIGFMLRWQDEIMKVANRIYNLDGCCHWEGICDHMEQAEREHQAFEAIRKNWWKPVATTYSNGEVKWRAHNYNGSPEPGRDWDDPVDAILEAEKARKAREECL